MLLRTTTRVNTGKSVVSLGEPVAPPERRFEPDVQKCVMIRLRAEVRHVFVEERLQRLRRFAETTVSTC